MPFTVTVQPSGKTFSVERDEPILQAAIRQGIGLPYGCRDGACGSCKCRMLEGRVIHGAHQQKALSHEEEVAGLILTCQAAPQTDIVLEARTVPGAGEFAIRKLPSRVVSIDKPAPDVAIAAPAAAGQRPVPVPRRPVRRVHPARRRAAQLLDGQRAAHRRRQAAARAAHPPPARRQVHRPRLRRDEGKGDPARRRAVRQLLPARGLRQADRSCSPRAPASRRSRRSSST